MNVFSTIGLNKRTAPRIVGRLPCVGEMVLVFNPTIIQSNPWAETKIYMVKGFTVAPNIFLMPFGGPDNGEEERAKKRAKAFGKVLMSDRRKLRSWKAEKLHASDLVFTIEFWDGTDSTAHALDHGWHVITEHRDLLNLVPNNRCLYDLRPNKHFAKREKLIFAKAGYFGDDAERMRMHRLMAKQAQDSGVDWLCYTDTRMTP